MRALPYNPGGLTVPKGYRVPAYPYGDPPAGALARLYLTVISAVIATFNTLQFTLRRNEADGSFTAITFEFYVDPTPAPVLPIVAINLTGVTTAIQIANAISLAVQSAGFQSPVGSGAQLIITQPFAGSQGDVAFFNDFNGNTLLAVGAGPAFSPFLLELTQYGDTMFWGGNELTVPLRIGKIFGMAPVVGPVFSNGSIVG